MARFQAKLRLGVHAIAVAMLACVLIATALDAASAITCGDVARTISRCISYAQNGGMVPPGCCIGARSLNSEATTTLDRQQACRCLQSVIQSVPGIRPDLVAGLPGRCGINIGYPIALSTDCSKVK